MLIWRKGELWILQLKRGGDCATKKSAQARKYLMAGINYVHVFIGATRTKDSSEVFYARSAVVTHAAAYGLQAIDIVFIDLDDIESLYHEAQIGAHLGYSGKQIIHPKQVVPERDLSPL